MRNCQKTANLSERFDGFFFSNVQMAYILGFFFGLGVEVLPDAAVAATYREIKCKKTRKSSFFTGKINQN